MLLVVKVQSDICGVCQELLVLGAIFPDRLATTVGHEPPIAWARDNGWKIVAERPEHWGCNSDKRDRPDGIPSQTAQD